MPTLIFSYLMVEFITLILFLKYIFKNNIFSFYLKLKSYFYIFFILLFYYTSFFGQLIAFVTNLILLKINNRILVYLIYFNKLDSILKSHIYVYIWVLLSECIYLVNSLNWYFLNLYLYYGLYYLYFLINFIYIKLIYILKNFLESIDFIIKKSNFYNKVKNFLILNLYNIEHFMFWNKKYYLKMSLSFWFQKNRRLVSFLHYRCMRKFKRIYISFKYRIYYVYFRIDFKLLNIKWYLVVYIFFSLIKFLQLFKTSFIKIIIDSNIIYKYFKKIERKKWYISEICKSYDKDDRDSNNNNNNYLEWCNL